MKRASTAAALFGLSLTANANGAMGLGLEQWHPLTWAGYVAAMVAFESWFIGGWLKMAWPKALTVSLLANALTGLLGGPAGCCAVFLHYPMVGTQANPNPLLSAIALLAVWAIPSALIEALFWRKMFRVGSDLAKGEWLILGRTLAAHFVSIPLGMAILLIPDRPYVGMEALTKYVRRNELREIAKELEAFTIDKGHLPQSLSIDDLLREVPRTKRDWDSGVPRKIALHLPEFRRFDVGEAWRQPYSINSEMSGKRIDPEDASAEAKEEWYLRPPRESDESGWTWGIKVDLSNGLFRIARFPRDATP